MTAPTRSQLVAESVRWNPSGVRAIPFFKRHADTAGYLNLQTVKELGKLLFHERTKGALDLFMQEQKVTALISSDSTISNTANVYLIRPTMDLLPYTNAQGPLRFSGSWHGIRCSIAKTCDYNYLSQRMTQGSSRTDNYRTEKPLPCSSPATGSFKHREVLELSQARLNLQLASNTGVSKQKTGTGHM